MLRACQCVIARLQQEMPDVRPARAADARAGGWAVFVMHNTGYGHFPADGAGDFWPFLVDFGEGGRFLDHSPAPFCFTHFSSLLPGLRVAPAERVSPVLSIRLIGVFSAVVG